jgi:hypothetical protein
MKRRVESRDSEKYELPARSGSGTEEQGRQSLTQFELVLWLVQSF